MAVSSRYWDSDCFLGWLQAEPDKEQACRTVLEAAEQGDIVIVTSALTLSEVLIKRGERPIPKSDRLRVETFFQNRYIVVRNITRRIAESSRALVWDHGIAPRDSLHVATALDARLNLLNTFDERLIRKGQRLSTLGLKIERPQVDQPTLPLGGGR